MGSDDNGATQGTPAEVLAQAFLHYPSMDWAFEGESDAEQLRKLVITYDALLDAVQRYGGVVHASDGTGALLWLPGTHFPLGLWRELWTSIAALPFRIGFHATKRLSDHEDESIDYIVTHGTKSTMGVIWNVGVAPAGRGKGHCRDMVRRAIDAMRADGLREFWLATDAAVNVAIYEKLGFEVVHKRVVRCSGIQSWVMRQVIE
ncbi:Aste57867_12233 [Aphanomyces stellatus]|uniref:Aste57867_12233 protein n=1 Tax=Aphanomyces stellatus TaxID=120398 RepID=A0A485KVT0_9STRA|nr:hypothetical protein As57867_012188 [Aphanomyces stellatus]VFT89087.1 Aste57867_12233 [Aphanomyces stellatus]